MSRGPITEPPFGQVYPPSGYVLLAGRYSPDPQMSTLQAPDQRPVALPQGRGAKRAVTALSLVHQNPSLSSRAPSSMAQPASYQFSVGSI